MSTPFEQLSFFSSMNIQARGIDEHHIEVLAEQVPILPGERRLKVGSNLGQEQGGSVEVLKCQLLKARRLHRANPLRALKVRTWRTEPLESHGEARSLHIKLKPSISRQSLDDRWQPLLFP